MGADLIGYHVVGPKTLPEAKRKPAVRKVAKALASFIEPPASDRRKHEQWERRMAKLEDYGFFAGDPEITVTPKGQSLYGFFAGDPEITVTPKGQSLEAALELRALEIVHALYDLWNNGGYARDLSARYFGRWQIMFCGELSWGDEPCGVGYQTLKAAFATGLADLFNFR